MVLSSGAVYARPRLPALIPPDPEPRHGGGQVEEALWIGPGIANNLLDFSQGSMLDFLGPALGKEKNFRIPVLKAGLTHLRKAKEDRK
jgi:hypothetical protein